MSNAFISVMEKIGHDIKVAWDDVVKYLPTAASLATVIFPAQTATIAGVVNSVGLIRDAVATIEQKYTAAGQAKSGVAKLSQAVALVGPTVTDLLTKEGLFINSDQLNKIINAVVAILNVPTLAA